MTQPALKKRYTPAEYYELEHVADYKSEYYDGEIFAMSGGTSDHSLITMNLGAEVRQRLKGKPCAAYESNMRLKVKATGLRTYPDVSVYGGALEYDPEDPRKTTAMNPTALFEVLSPSTELYDRSTKAEHYRQIETLRAYLLVSRDRPHVEMQERAADGGWLIREANGLNATIRIDAIGVELPLSEIYDRAEFPNSAPSERPSGSSKRESSGQ